MKRTLVTAFSLLAMATLGFVPTQLVAAEKAASAEKKAEKAEVKDATGKDPATAAKDATKEAAGKPIPFVGKATAVDAAAKTFSINGAKGKDRVFAVDEATKITKDGKPAALTELTVGEQVTGSYVKAGDTQTAKSVKIGGKSKPAEAAAAKEGSPGVKPAGTTPTGAVEPAKGGAGAPGATPAAGTKKKP
jgi:hypothetical protein